MDIAISAHQFPLELGSESTKQPTKLSEATTGTPEQAKAKADRRPGFHKSYVWQLVRRGMAREVHQAKAGRAAERSRIIGRSL